MSLSSLDVDKAASGSCVMCISIKKSAAVYFHLKVNTLQKELNLKLRDDLLLTVDYVKNPVVFIDDYVELNPHMNYVVNATLTKFSFTLKVIEAFSVWPFKTYLLAHLFLNRPTFLLFGLPWHLKNVTCVM